MSPRNTFESMKERVDVVDRGGKGITVPDILNFQKETTFFGSLSNADVKINVLPSTPTKEMLKPFPSEKEDISPAEFGDGEDRSVCGDNNEKNRNLMQRTSVRRVSRSYSSSSSPDGVKGELMSTPIIIGHRKHFSDSIIMPPTNFVDSTVRQSTRKKSKTLQSLPRPLLRKHQSESELAHIHREQEDETDAPKRSESSSNLTSAGLSDTPPEARVRRTSSQRDITATPAYREIYADKLRLYGFLLAKELGSSNRSPEQLRKSYLHNRHKANERKERSQSEFILPSRKMTLDHSNIVRERPTRKISAPPTMNWVAPGEAESEVPKKKSSTTVIRRKHATVRPPNRRISAPQMGSLQISEDKENIVTMETSSASSSPLSSMSSLNQVQRSRSLSSLCSTEQEEMSSKSKQPESETVKRAADAMKRQNWRMEQLKSFDDMLSQAGSYIRERKSSKISPPSSRHGSQGTSLSDLTTIEAEDE